MFERSWRHVKRFGDFQERLGTFLGISKEVLSLEETVSEGRYISRDDEETLEDLGDSDASRGSLKEAENLLKVLGILGDVEVQYK